MDTSIEERTESSAESSVIIKTASPHEDFSTELEDKDKTRNTSYFSLQSITTNKRFK